MGTFNYKLLHNQDEFGSSSLLFDLRNSTNILRKISWDEKRLTQHINFMMNLHEKIFNLLYEKCHYEKFAMNDTGDGYLCIFWDKIHAITCMNIAIEIKEFLKSEIPKHNKTLELNNDNMFDYGFAIHSGGSTIGRSEFKKENIAVSKDFIFGIVANSVSRLESLNKIYSEYKFLATGNYKRNFVKQCKNKDMKDLFSENSEYVHKSLGRININDGKQKGHYIYALNEKFFKAFKKGMENI